MVFKPVVGMLILVGLLIGTLISVPANPTGAQDEEHERFILKTTQFLNATGHISVVEDAIGGGCFVVVEDAGAFPILCE